VGRSKADGHSVCDRGMSGAERHAAEQRSPGYLLNASIPWKGQYDIQKIRQLEDRPLVATPTVRRCAVERALIVGDKCRRCRGCRC
jgi:hypothetical protein